MRDAIFQISEATRTALRDQLGAIGAKTCPLCAKPLVTHDIWLPGSEVAGVCPCCRAHLEYGPDSLLVAGSPIQTAACVHERSGRNGPYVVQRCELVGYRARFIIDEEREAELGKMRGFVQALRESERG